MIILFLTCLRFHFSIPGIAKNFTQDLNHFDNHDSTTFSQRYFINSSFISPKDPVKSLIVYLGDDLHANDDQSPIDSVFALARRTYSLVASLEHRFFGESVPSELTSDNLKHLTIEQALEDLAKFISYMKETECKNCKTIVVGGSYFGSLATWFRMKYPHFADAAWASSAPLNIINDFYQYDENVALEIERLIPGCSDVMVKLLSDLENIVIFGDRSKIKEMKIRFGFNVEQDDISFLYVIAETLSNAIVQYSQHDYLVKNMCDNIKNDDMNGLIKSFKEINSVFDDTPVSLDPLSYENTSIFSKYHNERAWNWLKCNQLGLFQTSSRKMRSHLVNLTYFNNACQKLFHKDYNSDNLINMEYGGSNPISTNVIFVNGELDPWRNLSVIETDPLLNFFTEVIPNASHCTDLSTTIDSNQTDNILKVSERWIKIDHFQCHNGGMKIFDKCKCTENFGGEYCEYSKNRFRIVSILSVLTPTILLIIVGLTICLSGKGNEIMNEFGNRPKLYLYV